MNEKVYTVEAFTDLIKYIFNRGYDGFKKMYASAGLIGEDYIQEKWNLANRNFGYWWCELSSDYQEQFITFAHMFYENL